MSFVLEKVEDNKDLWTKICFRDLESKMLGALWKHISIQYSIMKLIKWV